jgi:hypothetical protein
MMNNKQVVIGIFENEMYAIIAKKDLKAVGINANLLKDGGGLPLPLLNQADGIQLMVPDIQVEKARKILKTKFN